MVRIVRLALQYSPKRKNQLPRTKKRRFLQWLSPVWRVFPVQISLLYSRCFFTFSGAYSI